MKKHTGTEAKEFTNWLGETYDSEKIDIEMTNKRFEKGKKDSCAEDGKRESARPTTINDPKY